MQKKDFLLVDDDPLYLSLVEAVVCRAGLGADTAQSAGDALVLLQMHNYSTVITDLNMPGLDGLEFSRLARCLVPRLYIVMVSGSLTDKLAQEALCAGVDEVHAKPCRLKELRELVYRLPALTRLSPE
jgi:DNA-binding response OmpR family regulator